MDAKLKQLESKLQETYDKGREKNVFVGGYGGGHLYAESYQAVEQHEAERRRLAKEVKKARAESKREHKALKRHAQTVNDAASWTAKAFSHSHPWSPYVTPHFTLPFFLYIIEIGFF